MDVNNAYICLKTVFVVNLRCLVHISIKNNNMSGSNIDHYWYLPPVASRETFQTYPQKRFL